MIILQFLFICFDFYHQQYLYIKTLSDPLSIVVTLDLRIVVTSTNFLADFQYNQVTIPMGVIFRYMFMIIYIKYIIVTSVVDSRCMVEHPRFQQSISKIQGVFSWDNHKINLGPKLTMRIMAQIFHSLIVLHPTN